MKVSSVYTSLSYELNSNELEGIQVTQVDDTCGGGAKNLSH